ncbi:MAG: SPFH/Band 7/PHB domain protein [Alphaproteobacteria bacterium]|nr:MAG: SPFH/Band 7/PHB domain protein [Alphaproteobacteria bacterium]
MNSASFAFGPYQIFAALVVVVAIFLILKYVRIVRQGSAYTVERFGRYTRTLGPGLHLLVPFIESVGAELSLKEQVLDIPNQEVITRDNAMVGVDGVVFYQVLDAAKAAYEVQNLELAILNLTMTNIRTVIGSMDLDEILSQRDKINASLLTVVDEATSSWGVKVTRIEIKDISPPRDIVDAMARQMKAEREKRAAILEAEGERGSEILRAEGEKQAAILEAEGRRQAAVLEAEARERLAQAEAEATRVVSQAIAEGDARAIQYFVAQKYVEAVGRFADSPNGRLVFMPLEATGLIGSIGGIRTLFEEGGPFDGAGAPAGGGPTAGPSGGGVRRSTPRPPSSG